MAEKKEKKEKEITRIGSARSAVIPNRGTTANFFAFIFLKL